MLRTSGTGLRTPHFSSGELRTWAIGLLVVLGPVALVPSCRKPSVAHDNARKEPSSPSAEPTIVTDTAGEVPNRVDIGAHFAEEYFVSNRGRFEEIYHTLDANSQIEVGVILLERCEQRGMAMTQEELTHYLDGLQ